MARRSGRRQAHLHRQSPRHLAAFEADRAAVQGHDGARMVTVVLTIGPLYRLFMRLR